MKSLVSAIAVLILAGCGNGLAPGQGKQSRSASAVSDATRQQIIDACSPPFTGISGTGGLLSGDTCGVAIPASGADQDAQLWWDFAGCLVDHPAKFSDACRAHFDATCGHNGDLCICDVGEVLQDDGSCTPAAPSTCLTITQACHDAGLNCGTVSDNCGGTYDCGACTAPETCGGSGHPNICGVPPPVPPGGDTIRQQVIDACSPPLTAVSGGKLSCDTCGVPVPTGGIDQNPQHWWFFAGCLVDHASMFSDACISNFDSKCGHNGDLCICNPGETLQDDGTCL